MSGLFGLDDAGNRALADEVAANPILPEDVRPGFGAGTLSAIPRAIPQAAGAVARAAELAVSVPVGVVGALLAPQDQGDVTQKYFETVDPYVQGWSDYFTPNPKETGTAANIIGGVSEGVALLAMGGGNPALLIASTGLSGAMDLSKRVGNPDIAAAGGTLQAAATAVGFKVPFIGKSLPMRVASGGFGFAGLNAAAVEAQKQLLLVTGYNDLAAAYQPFNATDRTVDMLMGGVFGAVHHYGPGGMRITADTRDAALVLANAHHAAIDTAPGIPADIETVGIHQQAIDQAMGQLLRDEPVVPPASIAGASFEPRPETFKPSDVPEDLKALDAGLAPRAPGGEPANPIDFAAAPAEKLQQLKALTAQNVPDVQRMVADLNKQLSGSESKWNIKTDQSTLEKATRPEILATKPWFSVEHIRDNLRFKTIISDLTQIEQVPKILAAHGITVLKIDSAKMLTPKAWGWRSANLDLLMPNGQIIEHYTVLKEVDDAQQAEGHALYEEGRGIDVNDGPAAVAKLIELRARSKALYQAAWEAGLARTGTSGSALRASLDSFDTSATASMESRSGSESQRPVLPDQTPLSRTAPNPSKPPTVTTDRSGVPATKSALSSEVPIGGIIPESAPLSGASAHNVLTSTGRQVEPAVESAAALAQQQPKLRVTTGETNPDGSPETVSAAEAMAKSQADVAKAEADAKAYTAAVDCATQKGIE